MSQPTYKFKWANTAIDDYMRNRRYVAQSKRRQAEILVEQAQAIEMEMHELELSLIPVEEKKELKYEASTSTNPPTLTRV